MLKTVSSPLTAVKADSAYGSLQSFDDLDVLYLPFLLLLAIDEVRSRLEGVNYVFMDEVSML